MFWPYHALPPSPLFLLCINKDVDNAGVSLPLYQTGQVHPVLAFLLVCVYFFLTLLLLPLKTPLAARVTAVGCRGFPFGMLKYS